MARAAGAAAFGAAVCDISGDGPSADHAPGKTTYAAASAVVALLRAQGHNVALFLSSSPTITCGAEGSVPCTRRGTEEPETRGVLKIPKVPNSRLETLVRSASPAALLDVGCGCGHFTRKLAQLCRQVVAIDVLPRQPGWQNVGSPSAIQFCRMNALALGFASESFPLVLERATLHHIALWPQAMAEMMRVSSHLLLLQEPLDDLRSAAKQRTYEAQGLFLALQAEVGYPHYRHLDRDALLSAVKDHAGLVESHVERSDTPLSFDEFFASFGEFATQSARPAYWLERLQELLSRFNGEPLCEDDTITVLAAKGTRGVPT